MSVYLKLVDGPSALSAGIGRGRREKELAELLMLIDLGRNDIGRIAAIGTVELTDLMVIERYSHVMHMVSEVYGQLDWHGNADLAIAICTTLVKDHTLHLQAEWKKRSTTAAR